MRGKTVKDQKRGKENRGLLTSLILSQAGFLINI